MLREWFTSDPTRADRLIFFSRESATACGGAAQRHLRLDSKGGDAWTDSEENILSWLPSPSYAIIGASHATLCRRVASSARARAAMTATAAESHDPDSTVARAQLWEDVLTHTMMQWRLDAAGRAAGGAADTVLAPTPPAAVARNELHQPELDRSDPDQTADPDQTTDPDKADPDQTTDPDKTDPDQRADPDKTDPDQTTDPDKTDPDKADPDQTADPDKTDPDQTADPDKPDPDQTTDPDKTDPDQKAGLDQTADPDQTTDPDKTDPDQTTDPDKTDPDQKADPDQTADPDQSTDPVRIDLGRMVQQRSMLEGAALADGSRSPTLESTAAFDDPDAAFDDPDAATAALPASAVGEIATQGGGGNQSAIHAQPTQQRPPQPPPLQPQRPPLILLYSSGVSDGGDKVGDSAWLQPSQAAQCGCTVSRNRSLAASADALLFQQRDVLHALQKQPRWLRSVAVQARRSLPPAAGNSSSNTNGTSSASSTSGSGIGRGSDSGSGAPWLLQSMDSPVNSARRTGGQAQLTAEQLRWFSGTVGYRASSDYGMVDYPLGNFWRENPQRRRHGGGKGGGGAAAPAWPAWPGQAAVMWLSSDCDAVNGRRQFVRRLMAVMEVDSYGACLQNRAWPAHLDEDEEEEEEGSVDKGQPAAIRLMSHYPFVLALESSDCEEQVTEKLTTVLRAGSVPIVFNAFPRKYDALLPHHHSAVHIRDYGSLQELAAYLTATAADEVAWRRHHRQPPASSPLFTAAAARYEATAKPRWEAHCNLCHDLLQQQRVSRQQQQSQQQQPQQQHTPRWQRILSRHASAAGPQQPPERCLPPYSSATAAQAVVGGNSTNSSSSRNVTGRGSLGSQFATAAEAEAGEEVTLFT